MANEELAQLARDIYRGKTFITNNKDGYEHAFGLILSFMPKPKAKWLNNVGAMFEDYAKAGKGSINGYPIFWSCKMLHVDDLPILMDKLEAMEQAAATI